MNIAKQLLSRPMKLAFCKAQNPARFLSSASAYKYIKVEQKGTDNRVGLITLNRPESLNALCVGLINEVHDALRAFDSDPKVAATVVTGGEKVFAAGADIKEMVGKTWPANYMEDFISSWERLSKMRKPVIAAVNGYVLGGGCEMILMFDIVYAGDKARFGQPEIKIGTIPGAGGTQRLTRAIGKSRAMEMCITGDMIDANEALRLGLVSKVFPAANVIEESIKLADKIGALSKPIVAICKASVNNAYETTLEQGLRTEKALFHSTFGTNDRSEGMKAFAEKRPPAFTDS